MSFKLLLEFIQRTAVLVCVCVYAQCTSDHVE